MGRCVVKKECLVKLEHNVLVHFFKMHPHLIAQQLIFSETSTHPILKFLYNLLNSSILNIFGRQKLAKELRIPEFADKIIYVANF